MAGDVDDFRLAVEEAAYDELIGKENNLVFQAVQRAHDRLRDRGAEYGYDVEPVIESFRLLEADRDRGVIRIGWSHPAAEFFEFGTSPHTIEGDPVLSFVWEDAPDEIAEAFPDEGDGVRVFFSSVDVSGINEIRFVRAGLEYLTREGADRGLL